MLSIFFFFNDTATTEIYTLSYTTLFRSPNDFDPVAPTLFHNNGDGTFTDVSKSSGIGLKPANGLDRKSTRLNSSHGYISYAVFCLKKKKYIKARIPRNS